MPPSPIPDTVRRANVIYTLESFQTGIPHVPPYVANGLLGGCFDLHGFHSRPNTGIPEGRTHLGYSDHYHRATLGRHYRFPLATINAAFADGTQLNLVDCATYRQELDLYAGTLTTSYDLYGPTAITAFASQAAPNLFVMHFERTPAQPNQTLRLTIECETHACQNKDTRARVNPVEVTFSPHSGGLAVESRTNVTSTRWLLHCPTARFTTDGTRVLVDLPAGAATLKMLILRPDCPGPELLPQGYDILLAAHSALWADHWKTSWASFPDPRAHLTWTRNAYYIACNMARIPVRPMLPTGLNANIWSFYFPQDVYFFVESAPRLGHLDRARKAAQYWLDCLPDVCAYGRRLMGVEGAYYPWTPPEQDWAEYEKDGLTCPDSYELHNPAYVLAIVWHYFQRTNDLAFLRKFFPVIQEVTRFYVNISSKNATGTYDIYHKHARGQDEASTTDGRLKNLLCAQYSAEYSARALAQAADLTGLGDPALLTTARDIVKSGYNRAVLLRPEGWFVTYEGDDRPLNSQKHPVQLNPIAYLPMPDLADSAPTQAAWQHRFDLTASSRRPLTLGWTYGEFFLASVRQRSPQDAEKDLRCLQPCRAADPRWIQFYESSYQEGWHLRKAYYFPMSGLFLQGFTDTLLQDWRGHLDLFPCLLPGWETQPLAFHGLHAVGGIVVSASLDRENFSATLQRISDESAPTVRLRVAPRDLKLTAAGQASGPAAFASETIVDFSFRGTDPIVLQS